MFQGISNLASLFSQARQMQGRMAEVQEALKKVRVEGSAGAGLVTVEMNGHQQALGCRIDPRFFESGDREMLEDLIVSAVNLAAEKAKQASTAELSKLTQGVDLQALSQTLSKFGIGPGSGESS